MDMNQVLAAELNVKPWQVEAAVKLIDEGNTIPFISRYRKEATGSLNDEILRNLYDRLMYLRSLNDRKAVVLASIEEQGKLTAELKKSIEEAATLVVVEDLYRPYRPKRRTRATIAKEKGLEPLANIILLQMTKEPLEKEAEAFVSEEKEVKTAKDAIAGACDIIAESISDEADYRMEIRRRTEAKGLIVSTAKDEKAESVYENYYEFSEPVSKIAGHRVLALNRGEKEKFLNVKIEAPTEEILRYLEKKIITKESPQTKPVLQATIEDAYNRLIAPAIEREVRNQLTEKAEDGAIKVFGKNLEQLLMQPPIAGQVVLGWDPAFRTGCKLAVVDATGKVLDTTVVYPTAPTNEKKIAAAKATVKDLIHKYGVTLISVGNGTASRESEQIIVEILKEIPEKVAYVITNEAGASVYSASKLATEEFPNFDVGQRSAASIARRVQDPLAFQKQQLFPVTVVLRCIFFRQSVKRENVDEKTGIHSSCHVLNKTRSGVYQLSVCQCETLCIMKIHDAVRCIRFAVYNLFQFFIIRSRHPDIHIIIPRNEPLMPDQPEQRSICCKIDQVMFPADFIQIQ